MAILCSLKNIYLSFGIKQIFNGASLTVSKGDKIGLLGLNGKGKSTLFKILTDELVPDHCSPPFIYDKWKGDGENSGFKTFRVPQEFPLKNIKFQNIEHYVLNFYPKLGESFTQLNSINDSLKDSSTDKLLAAQKNILEVIEHLDGWRIIQDYQSYLKYFELNDFSKSLSLLSGGEQRKILLSIGLSCRYPLILWDEPTNHLDIETIDLLETELLNSQSSFILISHDRSLLSKVTNKIISLDQGEIQPFQGSYTEYLEDLALKDELRQKTLDKIKNSLRRETAWMRQGIKARGTRSKKRVENYEDLKSTASHLKSQEKAKLDLYISEQRRKAKKLIECQEVSFAHGPKTLFSDFNVIIGQGDKIGLLGPNGVGKTTLAKLLSGEYSPCSGTIKSLDGIKIQFFEQKREGLNESNTPFELLGEGSDFIDLPNGSRKHVTGYFENFLFHRDDVMRPISTFSGGEKGRLQLALNLKKSGDLWIFDEPTNDLDLETIQILEQQLSEFKGALLLISHDRSFLANITNKVWLLEDERIEVFDAGFEQVSPYLEALKIEKSLLQESNQQQPVEKEATNKKQAIKLSNKEKMRAKTLHRDIEKLEKNIAQIQSEIDSFDFSNVDQPTQESFQQLNKKLEKSEETLLEYYELLEKIEG